MSFLVLELLTCLLASALQLLILGFPPHRRSSLFNFEDAVLPDPQMLARDN
jgi:hypothetical protein